MFYLRARQGNPSIFSGFLKAGSCHDPPQLPGTLVEPDWSGTCIDPLPLPSKCQNYGNVILKLKEAYKNVKQCSPHFGFCFLFLSFKCSIIIIVYMICVVGTYSVTFMWSSEDSSVELVLAGLHGFWVSDSDCQACTASAWSAEPPCLSTHNAF